MANNEAANQKLAEFIRLDDTVLQNLAILDPLKQLLVRRGARALNEHVVKVMLTNVGNEDLRAQAANLIIHLPRIQRDQRVIDVIRVQMLELFNLLEEHIWGNRSFIALKLAFHADVEGEVELDTMLLENDLFRIFVMQYNDGTLAAWLCAELREVGDAGLIDWAAAKGERQRQAMLQHREHMIANAQLQQQVQLDNMFQHLPLVAEMVVRLRQQAHDANHVVVNAGQGVIRNQDVIARMQARLQQARAQVAALPAEIEERNLQLEAQRQQQQAAEALARDLHRQLLENEANAFNLQQLRVELLRQQEEHRRREEQARRQLQAQAAAAVVNVVQPLEQSSSNSVPAVDIDIDIPHRQVAPLRLRLRPLRHGRVDERPDEDRAARRRAALRARVHRRRLLREAGEAFRRRLDAMPRVEGRPVPNIRILPRNAVRVNGQNGMVPRGNLEDRVDAMQEQIGVMQGQIGAMQGEIVQMRGQMANDAAANAENINQVRRQMGIIAQTVAQQGDLLQALAQQFINRQ